MYLHMSGVRARTSSVCTCVYTAVCVQVVYVACMGMCLCDVCVNLYLHRSGVRARTSSVCMCVYTAVCVQYSILCMWLV